MTSAGRRQPVRRLRPFTPTQESAALLSERTVGREAILQTLDQRLLSAATTGNRAHTLLIGPRGSGKTHLLNVAIYRARQRAEVAERLAFVRFDEDAVGISRYDDLLHEVLVKLGPSNPAGRRPLKTDRPEGAVRDALQGRVLVLVIENLDRVFQALGLSGQQNFRAWVETSEQVMVLATAPLLFRGVQDRAMPWWGNFGISHLDELDLDQGRELLVRLARESGDLHLADYLGTDEGLARLRAINDVAGGSPRIWTILSECLTVELLDELVPAVEALLEGLVPYYQQLLWDLSPVEQRLVRVLADGPHQAATVAELAEAAGIGQRVAATTLGRLADIRWVRPEKAPELDQRSTWYRLREPMLRHHLHYRSASDQPLPLIVEILKAWYSPAERRSQLALADPGSIIERFAAASLGSELLGDSTFSDRDIVRLQVAARTWVHGGDADTRTVDAGILVDLAVTAVAKGDAAARKSLANRPQLDDVIKVVASEMIGYSTDQNPAAPAADRVGDLLRLMACRTADRNQVILGLISASWDGPLAPAQARDRLQGSYPALGKDDPLRLSLEHELAYWTGEAGDVVVARDRMAALVPVCERVLGVEHPETLTARNNLAHWTGEAGDVVAARDQLVALVQVRERVLGAEHRDTLITRANLANWMGKAGDSVLARDQFAALVPVRERVLGADHRDTLTARNNLAYWTGEAGDPVLARDQFAALVPVRERVLGAEHPDTLTTRHNLAYWTGEAGAAASARDQFAALVPVRERVLGVEHPTTLAARINLAYWMGEGGDPIGACELAGQLLADHTGLSGVSHDQRAAATGILVHNLGRASAAHAGTIDQPRDVADLGVVGLLQAAINGSAEALVRLPSELVPIVEAMRAQHSDEQPTPASA